jgi:hypothetical protein
MISATLSLGVVSIADPSEEEKTGVELAVINGNMNGRNSDLDRELSAEATSDNQSSSIQQLASRSNGAYTAVSSSAIEDEEEAGEADTSGQNKV